jgi:hypothetical protein
MSSSIVTARLPANTVDGLAFIAEFSRNGDDSRGRLAAVETMHQRINLLLESGDPAPRLRELAAHAALLSDMAARYTVQALESQGARNAAIWQRLALQCQAAYTRTLIAIEGLKAQAKGKGRVGLTHDNDDAPDADSADAL